MIKPFKLTAATKDYLWGGKKLKTEYGKTSDTEIVAESWELSAHKDGCSVAATGQFAGEKLSDIIKKPGIVGSLAEQFEMFPVLIKLIDAAKDLSVQVHPSDEYALEKEGQYGKTEMWYIADAEPGSGIYYGFNRDVTKEELREAIREGRVTELLNFVPVKKGETYFIESGTVHAICGGLVIWELQQNSNLTYRVFDYNRVGADGKPRELHVEKAVEVTNLKWQDTCPTPPVAVCKGLFRLAKCKYFTAYSLSVKGEFTGDVTAESFMSLTVIGGSGRLNGETEIKKGDTIFFPAGSGKWTVTGTIEGLLARV